MILKDLNFLLNSVQINSEIKDNQIVYNQSLKEFYFFKNRIKIDKIYKCKVLEKETLKITKQIRNSSQLSNSFKKNLESIFILKEIDHLNNFNIILLLKFKKYLVMFNYFKCDLPSTNKSNNFLIDADIINISSLETITAFNLKNQTNKELLVCFKLFKNLSYNFKESRILKLLSKDFDIFVAEYFSDTKHNPLTNLFKIKI